MEFVKQVFSSISTLFASREISKEEKLLLMNSISSGEDEILKIIQEFKTKGDELIFQQQIKHYLARRPRRMASTEAIQSSHRLPSHFWLEKKEEEQVHHRTSIFFIDPKNKKNSLDESSILFKSTDPFTSFQEFLLKRYSEYTEEGFMSIDNKELNTLQNINKVLENIILKRKENGMEKTIQNKLKEKLKNLFKVLKGKFVKMSQSLMTLLTEEFSYFNMYVMIKRMVKLLVDADEFSFFVRTEAGWDVYSSYNDKYTIVYDMERMEALDEQYAKNPSVNITVLQELDETIINRIINNRKFKTLYLLRFEISSKKCMITYNLSKISNIQSAKLLVLEGSNSRKGDLIYQTLISISKYIIDTLTGVKYNEMSLSVVVDQTLSIKENFLKTYTRIFIEEFKNTMQELYRIQIIDFEKKENSPEHEQSINIPQEDCRDSNETELIEQTFSLKIPSTHTIFRFTTNYYDFRTIEASFYQTGTYYLKLLNFVSRELQKSSMYRFFVYNDDSVLLDILKNGDVIFMSRMFTNKFVKSNQVGVARSHKSGCSIKYKDLLSGMPNLIEKIELNFKGNPTIDKLDQHQVLYSGKNFELIPFRSENKIKSLYIIIKETGERVSKVYEKKLSNIQEEMTVVEDMPNGESSSMKKNMKGLLKNKVKNIKTLTTMSALKMTLNFLRSEEGQGTYVEEFIPDNWKEDDLPSSKRRGSSSTPSTSQKFRSIPKSTHALIMQEETLAKPTKQIFTSAANDGLLLQASFNILAVKSILEKHRLVWAMLNMENYFETYSIPLDNFIEFIHEIKLRYNKNSNPFHNYDHGVSVMQSCFFLVNGTCVKEKLSYSEKFTLVFSGLCHDVSHTGRNNNFEINSLSKLAIRYSDKSVIEHHHISVTFKILQKEKSNIFLNLCMNDVLGFRKYIINNILCTDMKEHFKLIASFEARLKEAAEKGEEFGLVESDKMLMCGILIHCADFNGAAKPWKSAYEWSVKVNQEFSKQYILEGEIGIEQTPYMKDLDQRDVMAKAEMGFLKVIVQPLWVLINKFLRNDVEEQVSNIQNNLKEWENIFNECMELKQKNSIQKSPRKEEQQGEKPEADEPKASPPKKAAMFFMASINKKSE